MTDDLATPEGRTRALEARIAALLARIEAPSRALNEAIWRANAFGDAAAEAESERLDREVRGVWAEPGPYRVLVALDEAGGVPDPLLARQLRLMLLAHRSQQVPADTLARMVALEKALEGRFNRFRATLDGEQVPDNRLREVLRHSDDADLRRRAWEASKQVGAEVRADLITLVRLRNEAARGIGFPNYYTMMLALDELDEAWLFALLDDVERLTRPRFEAYKRDLDARLAARFATAPDALRPWHYGDPFFQEAPPAGVDLDPVFRERRLEDVARDFFAAVGLPVDDLLARADLYERPGKCQHAFCLCVDRGADIRVLCNLRPNVHWMGTLLHELGHAVYDLHIDRDLPWLLRTHAHTLTTEASAMLFGRLSRNAAWLVRWGGMPRAEAEAAAHAIGAAVRDQLLVQIRWNLVMCHMERALYRDPEQDLDGLWWELVARFQRVRPPEGRRAPDWAAKIHFSIAPVYYQNYLLGEMMATQLQRHLLERVLGGGARAWERFVTSPDVGRFLVGTLYRPGRRADWRDTLRAATGEALSPEPIVAEVEGRA
uniref:Peptidase M3 n=1 Tax=Eiseniibacteriota bacterium TaxID=2212470 RepID=A0A832I042_UNCEI